MATHGEEKGEAEVNVPEEEGAAQAAMEMEEWDDSVFSFLFFSFLFGVCYPFLGQADYGEKEHWDALL